MLSNVNGFTKNKLQSELEIRKNKNSSFSLRAFARYLNIHPSYLFKLLNGTNYPSLDLINSIKEKIELSDEEIKIMKIESLLMTKMNVGHVFFFPERAKEIICEALDINKVELASQETLSPSSSQREIEAAKYVIDFIKNVLSKNEPK